MSGDYVEITSPMKGSPAEKAGLKPHDVIAIDGVDMTGVDPRRVKQDLRSERIDSRIDH